MDSTSGSTLPRDSSAGPLKDTAPAEIVQAIRSVAAGEPALSPTVTRQLIDHVTGPQHDQRQRARRLLDTLSEREREVALAVGRGLPNAEIAANPFMSVGTVKAHITRVLSKPDLNNRVRIALLTHDAGLV